jgi:hypothetical protein
LTRKTPIGGLYLPICRRAFNTQDSVEINHRAFTLKLHQSQRWIAT